MIYWSAHSILQVNYSVNMIYSYKLYIQDRWILVLFLATVALVAAQWWYTGVHVEPTDEIVFLHYNIVFGTDLVGSWRSQLTPPIVGSVVLVVNNLLSWILYKSSRLISRLLLVFAVAIEGALLVGQILMLSLNL